MGLSNRPLMSTIERLQLGRERSIEGRSLADLHREAVKLAVDIERERCARIADKYPGYCSRAAAQSIATEIRRGN